MIGFQCNPSAIRAPTSLNNSNNVESNNDNNYQANSQEGQETENCANALSTLNSHINLIKHQQPVSGSSTKGCMSPHHLNSSPGYHSAASSPTSPVSSSSPSSSSTASYSCSSSSANSSALSSTISPSGSASASPRSPISPNLLDYYPELNQDGLNLSWFHEANNKSKLNAALMTNKMIVSGDISLAEMSRYPVPIMAKPPLGVSDMTLENWLQEVVRAQPQRGVKLTFTSTRTVEPAFRVLARHVEQLKGPLILNADILTRPSSSNNNNTARLNSNNGNKQQNHHQQPVDAWTFLMLCRTRFPKSIISIGWCSLSAANNELLQGSDSGLSLHSSAESMFELDMMEPVVAPHFASRHHHLNAYPPIIHNSQQRHVISHQQLSQQLSNHHHHHHHLHQHNHHAGLTHHILSSTGSLTSSSGNSSGSPSPTSPISHLMSPPHQTIATNLSMNNKNVVVNPDSTDQLFLNITNGSVEQQKSSKAKNGAKHAAVAAAAAAAAMAAAVVAAGNFHQQMPLNLNINEAGEQQSSQQQQLNNLAQKIQSYQSISKHNLTQHQQDHNVGGGKVYSSQQQTSHIHKKAAITSGPNSNTPSPLSSSPKQAMAAAAAAAAAPNGSGSQLLLRTTSSNNSSSQQANSSFLGYTREMIDKMASLIKEYNLTQPVTFPVEAKLMRNSLPELQRLLYQVGSNSTLTVRANQEDLISIDDLLTIRKAFGSNQILFDLPDNLMNSLKQELELL